MIIRNLGVKKVLAENGDAIGIRKYPFFGQWTQLMNGRILQQCVG